MAWVRRIYEWYGSWSLASRQFLFLFAVTLAMLALMARSNLTEAEKLFKEQKVQDTQMLIQRTNQYLDSYLDNIQNILLLMVARPDYIAGNDGETIESYLRMIAQNNSSIAKTLYIMRDDGKVYSNTQLYLDIIGNPNLGDVYTLARNNSGAAFVSDPYRSPLSGQTVAITRSVNGPGQETIGVAVVEIDLDKLNRDLVDILAAGGQAFALINNRGRLVTFDEYSELLPHLPHIYRPSLPESFVMELSELPTGKSSVNGANGQLVTVKSGLNRLGWQLLVFSDMKSFYQGVNTLYDNFKTAAVFWTVILLFSSFMLSRYITRPLRMFVAKMDRVRDVQVLPAVSVRRNDEVGRLAISYNAMMERIQSLVQETKQAERDKKELELRMLQSQIAPHFLYNTLACVNSLAKQGRNGDVQGTVRSLVGVLSFSFDNPSEYVTLGEELDVLHKYVQIQQMRYSDKFEVEFDVEGDSQACAMLKLTLQPIVENAIFHGIAPGKRFGRIRVRAFIRSGRLLVFIRDNGLGMQPERARRLLAEERKKPSKDRFTGIGLRNVHERIRLHFGEAYGLDIRSVPGQGTIVRICMPAMDRRIGRAQEL